MGTIHEIKPSIPSIWGSIYGPPPYLFFCASILGSRLWVIKKSTRWGGSCRNSGHQLEIIHRNPRKTAKNKSSKMFVSSKKKSKHQSNQSVNSFSVFPKKSDKLLIFSAAFAVFGSGESCAFRCLDPWQRRVRRASSTCCHPRTLIQSLGISREFGCFFQWMFWINGCLSMGTWDFQGNFEFGWFFQWIQETLHILHWDYHECSTEIPKFSKTMWIHGNFGIIIDVPRKSLFLSNTLSDFLGNLKGIDGDSWGFSQQWE